MHIEKLPSGSYRITQMENRKKYSLTVPYKPSEKEAYRLIQDKINHREEIFLAFKDAAVQYNNAKKNVLSPRTIREYGLYIDRLPGDFIKMNVFDIKQFDIQQTINILSADKSPKTVRCLHGYISAVIGMFRPDFLIKTSLPQKVNKDIYIPSQDDVQRLLKYTEENYPHFFIPLWLGCLSLRRSEICALTVDDLDGTSLTINKALVQDSNKNWVVKVTKTTNSTRKITLPERLADMIHQQGYIYEGYPQSISNYMTRAQDALGMPHFSLHKTRHYFASKMMDAGYDMKTIQEWGGWAGPETLSKVYQHSLKMKQEEEKKKIASLFD